jgi:UDP-N-acetylmuramoyl-L-alanyl-D-glutamate--2,6-diaminopimelate ligase
MEWVYMKLKTLLQGMDVQIKGKKEIEITGLCSHSKKTAPGDLFIARKGLQADGSLFIEEALAAGAVAVMTDLYNPFLDVTQVITPSPKQLEVEIASRFYHHPSRSLFLIGVTGTNGKTTTCYLIKHLIEKKPHECGLMGTIENIIGDHRLPSVLTTPDIITVNHYLSEMLHQKCRAAVMEVTSHAMTQERAKGLEFDVGVFTNLSQDHLDYHGSMEEYAAAKALFFQQLAQQKHKPVKKAVMNLDDPYTPRLLKDIALPVLTYSIDNKTADLYTENLMLSRTGVSFVACYGEKRCTVHTSLVGRFNVYNSLAAMGVALTYGMSLEDIAHQFSSFPHVPGRLQKVHNSRCMNVYVDFAHTEQALENVLLTLKDVAEGKIITVVGCGGDRDKEKRPKMAHVVEHYSDVLVFTSDNPRSEDPERIIEDMLRGITNTSSVHIEVDRKKAIQYALSLAQQEDIVLIAGKGHECTQILKDKVVTLSDITVVEEYS